MDTKLSFKYDREIENLEILFFSTRLLRNDLLELPVTADLRIAATV
jgi:hypothetical protein